MRKLLIYLSVLALCGSAFAPQKPMLGELPDASQFPMPVTLLLFNEGSGSLVNDLSGNGVVGTIIGPLWRPGKFGWALDFDGSGDKVWIDTTKSLNTLLKGAASFSISQWVYSRGMGENNAGNFYCENDGAFNMIMFGAGVKAYCTHSGTNADVTVTTVWGTPVVPSWKHLITTYDAATKNMTIYVNGVDATTGRTTGTDVRDNFDDYLIIGNNQFGARSIDGLIDNTFLFDFVLTASQVAQLYINSFPWFVEDEITSMYVPPTVGGQVIFINFSSVGYGFGGFGLILILAVIRKLRSRK